MKKTLCLLFLSFLFVVDASTQTYSVNIGLNSTSSSQYWKRSSINVQPGISLGSSAIFDLSSSSKIKLTASYFSNSRTFKYSDSWFAIDKVKLHQNVIKIASALHLNLNEDFSFFAGIDYSLPISLKEQIINDSSDVIDTYNYDMSGVSGTTSVNFGISYLLYYMFDFELGCSILDYRRQSGSSYFDYNLYLTVGYIL